MSIIDLCSARAANDVIESSVVVSLPWSKFCLNSTQPGIKVCFIEQQNPAPCAEPVASANIYDDATRTRLSIKLRQTVTMERGVRISIDHGEAIFSGPFLQCDANGCLAVHEGGPELMVQLARGGNLVVEAADSSGQPVKIAISLAGLADAYFPRAAPFDSATDAKAGWQEWHALLSRAQGWRGTADHAADCPSGR
jgi:invasion protein IalB